MERRAVDCPVGQEIERCTSNPGSFVRPCDRSSSWLDMQEECGRAGPSYVRRVHHDGGGELNVGRSPSRLLPAGQQREKGQDIEFGVGRATICRTNPELGKDKKHSIQRAASRAMNARDMYHAFRFVEEKKKKRSCQQPNQSQGVAIPRQLCRRSLLPARHRRPHELKGHCDALL